MSLIAIQNYIGGALIPPASEGWIDNFEPATGTVYAKVPNSAATDIGSAVTAAQAAFPAWSALTAEDRSQRLLRLADLIEQNLESLAAAESRDNGKTIALARSVDIPRAAANFRFFAKLVCGVSSESHEMPDAINYTLRRPLGVVGCISPWNLPLYLFTWKIAPALAVGNCVVAKPSEVTPMTAFELSKLCIEADIPPGVLNIVHGSGAQTGNALIQHPDIKAISFTGGTATGAHIAREVAPQFKKLSLELGGKNPNIVFADCDYESALDTTVRSSFANQGQICLCGSRIYVERTLYERFRDDLVARASALRVGDPASADSDLGAVVSAAHQQKILACIDTAQQEGGTVLCGGTAVRPDGRCENGWFVAPTVIEGLSDSCQTNQEEIFGPVVTIAPFATEAEVMSAANGTKYGLAASVWTGNVQRAHRIARDLEAGVVWVNCWLVRDLRTPFGGMKASGVGREGGEEALRFFTEPKNVCIKY